jgi:hypothetical protein
VPGCIKTLCVTVTATVRCARVVFVAATRHIHFREVQGAVHATRQRRQFHVETQLLVSELDVRIVLAVRIEKIHTRRGVVVSIIAGRDVLVKGQDVSIGSDSARFVIEALDDAVFVAGDAVGAHGARAAHGA